MGLPTRKRNRLEKYDYSNCGSYFITLCVKERRPVLWNGVGANFVRPLLEPSLSEVGRSVEQEIIGLNQVYPQVSVDQYCIMPDHIHMILSVSDEAGAPEVSRVIKQFKGALTKRLHVSLWQRSFYDRVIRSREEYEDIWQYIENNPRQRWLEICGE